MDKIDIKAIEEWIANEKKHYNSLPNGLIRDTGIGCMIDLETFIKEYIENK